MSDSIATRLAAIEALCDAATPGPWEPHLSGYSILADQSRTVVVRMCCNQDAEQMVANQGFIASARTDVPWLVEQVRTLLIRDEVLQGAYRTSCCHREEAQDRVRELEARLREVCHEAAILLAACEHGNLDVDPSLEMALASTMDALHRLIELERGRTDG